MSCAYLLSFSLAFLGDILEELSKFLCSILKHDRKENMQLVSGLKSPEDLLLPFIRCKVSITEFYIIRSSGYERKAFNETVSPKLSNLLKGLT